MDLRNQSRWEFLNTLFSVSEAVAYMQVLSGAMTTPFSCFGIFYQSLLITYVSTSRWSTDWMKELLELNLVHLTIKDFTRQCLEEFFYIIVTVVLIMCSKSNSRHGFSGC